MLHSTLRRLITVATFLAGAQVSLGCSAIADGLSPHLTVVDPPGGKVGTSVDVQVSGTGLQGLTELQCDEPRIKASKRGEARFTIEIPADVPPGLYDLRALGANGLSSPHGFFVSPRTTLRETEPKGDGRFRRSSSTCRSADGSIPRATSMPTASMPGPASAW